MSVSSHYTAAIVVSLVVALSPRNAAAEVCVDSPLTLEQLMALMAEVKSARAKFTETRYSSLFDKPVTLTGMLVYERPSRVERTVLTPYEERFIADGDSLVIESHGGAHTRTVTLSSQPSIHAFVESIRATLAGDQETLERFYDVSLDGGAFKWALRLVPASTELSGYVSLIRILGVCNRISTVEIEEADGTLSVMTVIDEGARSSP
jgi:outer membrane lipoprotein-sorting protein